MKRVCLVLIAGLAACGAPRQSYTDGYWVAVANVGETDEPECIQGGIVVFHPSWQTKKTVCDEELCKEPDCIALINRGACGEDSTVLLMQTATAACRQVEIGIDTNLDGHLEEGVLRSTRLCRGLPPMPHGAEWHAYLGCAP